MDKEFEKFEPKLKINLKDGGRNVASPEDSSSVGIHIGGLLVLIIVAVTLFRVLNGSLNTQITFTSFLEFLRDVPQIDTSFISSLSSFELIADVDAWGIFSPIAVFANFFTNTFTTIGSIAMWFSAGIAQLAIFSAYIVGFLFA